MKCKSSLTLVIAASLIAALITTYRYITPLSGVTDAGGALLTLVSEFVICALGLIIAIANGPLVRKTGLVLAWILAVLCFIAELFLHGWLSAAFVAICLVGLCFHTFSARSSRI